jgi:hypothetical protein
MRRKNGNNQPYGTLLEKGPVHVWESHAGVFEVVEGDLVELLQEQVIGGGLSFLRSHTRCSTP